MSTEQSSQLTQFYLPSTNGSGWDIFNPIVSVNNITDLNGTLENKIKKDILLNANDSNTNTPRTIKVDFFPDYVLGQMVRAADVSPQQSDLCADYYSFSNSVFTSVAKLDSWENVTVTNQVNGETYLYMQLVDGDVTGLPTPPSPPNASLTTFTPYQVRFYFTAQNETYIKVTKVSFIDVNSADWKIELTNQTSLSGIHFDQINTNLSYFFNSVNETLLQLSNINDFALNQIKKKVGLNDVTKTSKIFLWNNPNSEKRQEGSTIEYFIGYANMPSFFFNVICSEEWFFKSTPIISGDWVLPTSGGWQVAKNVAIIRTLNEQSTGDDSGDISLYGGTLTNGGSVSKGVFYYSNVQGRQGMCLCLETTTGQIWTHSHFDDGDSQVFKLAEKPINVTMPNIIYGTNELEGTIARVEQKTSENLPSFLSGAQDWLVLLQKYIERKYSQIPTRSANGSITYTTMQTYGRRAILGENDSITGKSTTEYDFLIKFVSQET